MTVLTETRPTPVEVTTPIKASEALRLGRLTYPERYPSRFTDGHKGACALGAMLAGWGEPPVDDEGLGNWPAADARLGSSVAFHLACQFDNAEWEGKNGDAVVLAYLESRGL